MRKDLKLQAPHEAGLIKESFCDVRSSPEQRIYRYPLPKPKIEKCIIWKSWNWSAEETNNNYTEYQRHTKKKQPHIIEEEFAPEDGALSDLDFYWSHKTRWAKRREEIKFRFN